LSSTRRSATVAGLAGLLPLSLVIAIAGCSSGTPTGVNGASGGRFELGVGQQVQLRLQSIGPGEYAAPPQMSSGSAHFVNVSLVGPAVPAGVTQLYSFIGVDPGTTIVTFVHSGTSAIVVDTLVVH
jgi:hypothetical protein